MRWHKIESAPLRKNILVRKYKKGGKNVTHSDARLDSKKHKALVISFGFSHWKELPSDPGGQ